MKIPFFLSRFPQPGEGKGKNLFLNNQKRSMKRTLLVSPLAFKGLELEGEGL